MPGQRGSYAPSDAPRVDQPVESRASLRGREKPTTESLVLAASFPRLKCFCVSPAWGMCICTMHKQPSLQLQDAGPSFNGTQISEHAAVVGSHKSPCGHASENPAREYSDIFYLPPLSGHRHTEERRPGLAMDERYFPRHEIGRDYVRMFLELGIYNVYGVTLRMTPPRAAYGFSNNQRDHARQVAVSLHE